MSGDGDEVLYAELAGDLRRRSHRAFERIFKDMGSLQYEEGEDLFGKVQDCLRKLPEQQRKVLEMKIFRDMSYKEIARELNLSEVTVHTHVKRAYKAIREALPVVYFLWSVLGKI